MTPDPRPWPLEHGPRNGETIVALHGNNAGGWMWAPQVERLPDRHILTPDLLGLGERYREPWPGMAGAADDIAGVVREHAQDGRAHLVGLSLGGFVVVQLLHRYPDLVRSAVITGAAVAGLTRVERLLVPPQRMLLRRRWYWKAQALAFGVPSDGRELFVDSAVRVSAETNHQTYGEVVSGCMPTSRFRYSGPVLAIAGEDESRSARNGFPVLKQALPQLQTWLAPGMHHPWNSEDPDLFSLVIREFADQGSWGPAGQI